MKSCVKTLVAIILGVSLSSCSLIESEVDKHIQKQVDEYVDNQVSQVTTTKKSKAYDDPVLNQFKSYENRINDVFQNMEKIYDEYGEDTLNSAISSVVSGYCEWYCSLSDSDQDRVDDLLEESVAEHDGMRKFACIMLGSFISETYSM